MRVFLLIRQAKCQQLYTKVSLSICRKRQIYMLWLQIVLSNYVWKRG